MLALLLIVIGVSQAITVSGPESQDSGQKSASTSADNSIDKSSDNDESY